MFAVLLFAWGVQASGGNVHYEASGTSDFTITFKSMAQGFAVLASSNPITVIAKVGTTAVDTMVVEAGNSMFFYCPANNLAIDRTLATAVTINPTFNNNIIPNLGISTTAIKDAVTAPTPVSSSSQDMFSGLELIIGHPTATIRNHNHSTFPLTGGMDIAGAKAVVLELSWTKWVHGGFAIQPIYSASATDTGAASCVYASKLVGAVYSFEPNWADSISMDDSTAVFMTTPDSAAVNWRTNGTATIRLNNLPGAGYLFVRLYPHDYAIAVGSTTGIHIHGLNCVARKVE
jgi:hypothetical protein